MLPMNTLTYRALKDCLDAQGKAIEKGTELTFSTPLHEVNANLQDKTYTFYKRALENQSFFEAVETETEYNQRIRAILQNIVTAYSKPNKSGMAELIHAAYFALQNGPVAPAPR